MRSRHVDESHWDSTESSLRAQRQGGEGDVPVVRLNAGDASAPAKSSVS